MGKQEVINWFRDYMRAPEVDLVDDTTEQYARHVCSNGNRVFLLPKQVYNLQTPKGMVMIEYYQCQVCGKIIMNRNFM